jgi:SAM-dependent methyltransferase
VKQGLADLKPTERFTGLADLYTRYRPDYPAEAIDFILAHCHLWPGSLVVDVGSGTGTSSRQLAQRGITVIGIEPNEEMRQQAASLSVPEGMPAPTYRDGRGEETGLPDACTDAVLSAQAFHWLDAERALAEFRRILKPDGWVVLMWNERDEMDPFTAAYGDVLRSTPEGARLEARRTRAGEALLQSPLYQHRERVVFRHRQELDEDGVIGRARSASYAPRETQAVQVFCDALRQAFARHQCDGKVALHYETAVFVGQRR